MLSTTIRVQVGASVKEYAQDIAGYGEHLANGGETVSLHTAQAQAKAFFHTAAAGWTALAYWVTMDESGLAYHVEINRRGTWNVSGAAPMPGPNNVKDLYNA